MHLHFFTHYIDNGLDYVSDIIKTGYTNAELANKKGILQRIDPRIKLLFLMFYIIIISIKRDILSELIIAGFVLFLAVISSLDIFSFYKKVFFMSFIFGFVIALPSSLNLFNSGRVILPIVEFSKTRDLWFYHIPKIIGFTHEGVLGVIMLTLRVMNSLALSFLIVSATRFEEFIKALKLFKVPDTMLVIITLMYKYVFIFAKTVQDMYLAKKSRFIGKIYDKQTMQWMASRIVFLFKKTQKKYENIFNAMISRGFADDIKLYGLKEIDKTSMIVGIGFLMIGALLLWK
jgi:energy-coupling factor transporter transmembrane protein EcfT